MLIVQHIAPKNYPQYEDPFSYQGFAELRLELAKLPKVQRSLTDLGVTVRVTIYG